MSLGANDPETKLIETVERATAAGANWVQIREKDLPARRLLEVARAAVRAAAGHGALVFVNERIDVALAARAAGVHLGGESVDAREAIRWLRGGNGPEGFRVGVSCHSIEEAREAERAGADYVFFGPVFDTPAKRKFGAPQGIAKLKEACAAANIPAIAIGGVDGTNAAECLRAGAAGIAAIRLFQEARDTAVLADTIVQLRRAPGET